MKNKIHSRKFGKVRVEINYYGRITISDDWFTNYGLIYPHSIKRFKQGVINPVTGRHFQVIGMDSEISKTHANYIYDKIKKGYFDHLIEKDL